MPRFWNLQLDQLDSALRLPAVHTFLTRVRKRLTAHYPAGEGYAHTLNWLSPLDKHSNPLPVIQFELVVQRGDAWGVRLFLGAEVHDELRELKVAALEGSRLTAKAGFVAICLAVALGLAVALAALIGSGFYTLRGGFVVFLMVGVAATIVGAVLLTPIHLFMTRKMKPDLEVLGELVTETWAAEPIPNATLTPRWHPFVGNFILTLILAAAALTTHGYLMWGNIGDGTFICLACVLCGLALLLLTGAVLALGDLAGITEGHGVFGSKASVATKFNVSDSPNLDALFHSFLEPPTDTPA